MYTPTKLFKAAAHAALVEYGFQCARAQLFEALVDPERVDENVVTLRATDATLRAAAHAALDVVQDMHFENAVEREAVESANRAH